MISRKQFEYGSAFLDVKINFLVNKVLCGDKAVLLNLSESSSNLNLIIRTNKDVLLVVNIFTSSCYSYPYKIIQIPVIITKTVIFAFQTGYCWLFRVSRSKQ